MRGSHRASCSYGTCSLATDTSVLASIQALSRVSPLPSGAIDAVGISVRGQSVAPDRNGCQRWDWVCASSSSQARRIGTLPH